MKKLILFLAALALVFPSLSQVVEGTNLKIHNIEGYIYSHGSTGNATADSTLFFSVDNTTIQDEDLSNANVFTLNSGNVREIPDPVGRSGRIMFIKNGTGANVSLTLVSSQTMWADTLEGGGTIAPGELLMLVSDGEYWYARSPETFASVKTDSITSRTNNTDLKLVGQGTGGVEIEGAYVLPGVDGTSGYLVKTDGSGAWGYIDPDDVGTSVSFGTDNQIPHMNPGGTDFDYSSNLTFDGGLNVSNLRLSSNTLSTSVGSLIFDPAGTNPVVPSDDNVTNLGSGGNRWATGYFGTNVEVGGSPVVVDSDIGVNVQAWDQALSDISGLTPTDGNIIVGDGANWVAESGATARTSLGAGDLNGPGSSTDNTIPRFDGTSGKLIQGSSVEIDDSDNIDTNGGSLSAGAITATTGASGGTVNVNGDELAIRGSGTTGMSILSPDGSNQWIFFGDATDNDVGGINYNHSTNTLGLRTNGTSNQLTLDASGSLTAGAITGDSYTGTDLTGTGDQILYATSGGGVTRSSVDISSLSSSILLVDEQTITTGEISTLNSSPVTLISAPGSGNYIMIHKAVVSMDYQGTQWSGSGGLAIQYSASSTTIISLSASILESAADVFTYPNTLSGVFLSSLNSGVKLTTLSGDPTGGNSELKVKIWYTIESQ